MPLTKIFLQLLNWLLFGSTLYLYFFNVNLWNDQAFIASVLLGTLCGSILSLYWLSKSFFSSTLYLSSIPLFLLSLIPFVFQIIGLLWVLWLKAG